MISPIVAICKYWVNLTLATFFLQLFHSYYWKSHQVIKLGSGGGSWFIPSHLVKKNSVCYSLGVGEDISFDLDIIAQIGCKVYAFDPTPRSRKYLESLGKLPKQFNFTPVGIWTENKRLKFFAPQNKKYVSHSVVNLFSTKDYFIAPCFTIPHMMKKSKHKKIDLLKIDVEGAEFAILQSLLQTSIRPAAICVEIDQPIRLPRILAFFEIMHDAGYRLIKQDHWNFTYLHEKKLSI